MCGKGFFICGVWFLLTFNCVVRLLIKSAGPVFKPIRKNILNEQIPD